MKPISQEKLHEELVPSAFHRMLPSVVVKATVWTDVCEQGYSSAPWHGQDVERKHAGGAVTRESITNAIGRMFLEEGV